MRSLTNKFMQIVFLFFVLVNTTFAQSVTKNYGRENIALNKPVQAITNTQLGEPADVTDGTLSRVWYSYQGSPTRNTFIVDLEAVHSIDTLQVYVAQSYGFTVEASEDGNAWSTIADRSWTGSISGSVEIKLASAANARYLRYDAYANWNQYVGVVEFEVFETGSTAPAAQPGSLGTNDVALNAQVSYESGANLSPPANLLDNDDSTFWIPNSVSDDDATGNFNYEGLIEIDLGKEVNLGALDLVLPNYQMAYVVFHNDPNNRYSGPWMAHSKPDFFDSAQVFTGDLVRFQLNGHVTARYITLYIKNMQMPATATDPNPSLAGVKVVEWLGPALSITGSPTIKPLTDGLVLLRYLFNFSGDPLIADALDPDASRTSSDEIATYIQSKVDSGEFDIDGDNEVRPLTDGILVIRYLFGFRGDALISKALAAGATRKTAAEIESYLGNLLK